MLLKCLQPYNCATRAILLLVSGLFISGLCLAQAYESPRSITDAAEKFVKQHTPLGKDQILQVEAGDLDARLRLAKCQQPLQAFTNNGNSQLRGKNASIGVSCEGNKPWKIYVPVKVKILAPALTLNRRLNPGDVISSADVKIATRDIASMAYGYYSHTDEIEGFSAKRSLAAGTLLSPDMLKAPLLVQRGQTVTLTAANSSLSISMQGEAMMDGGKGQLIRVKNLSSGRIIEGIVQSDGSVKVNF